MLFAGVTHTVEGEAVTGAPRRDLDVGDCAFSHVGHPAVIHTLLWGFQNRKIGGVNSAREKHLGRAMISVKRCVFVMGAPPKTWRLCCMLPAQVQPWFCPPVSKMALTFISRASSGHGTYSWSQGLWNLEDNFPRCCDKSFVCYLNNHRGDGILVKCLGWRTHRKTKQCP